MKTINVGVIGAGYWGKKHVDEYSKIKSVNLAAVSDFVEKNLDFCKDVYNVKTLTKDYREILKSPDIDAVSICTPNESHFDICKDALISGKHVLIEKPITLDSRQAYELVDLSKERGLALCVGHVFRFNNAIKKVKELIKDNFFGDLGVIKIQWTNRRDPIENRDILFDLAPHPFDILNFITGLWPESVTCKAGMFRRKAPEEWAYIIAEFGENLTAHIEINWLNPGKKRELLVNGLNNAVRVNCLNQEISVYESGYDYNMDIKRSNTIGDELLHFIGSVNNKHNPDNDGIVGARTIEMIEKCFESLQKGSTVEV